jgi:hypothetical protein
MAARACGKSYAAGIMLVRGVVSDAIAVELAQIRTSGHCCRYLLAYPYRSETCEQFAGRIGGFRGQLVVHAPKTS